MVKANSQMLTHYFNSVAKVSLLTRDEELTIVRRIARTRRQLRRAILSCGDGWQAAVALLTEAFDGRRRFDRVVDVSLHDAQRKSDLRRRLGPNLQTLTRLHQHCRSKFAAATDRSQPLAVRRVACRRMVALRQKGIRLIEEVPLRMEYLHDILKGLRQTFELMREPTVRTRKRCGDGRCTDAKAALRHLMSATRETPSSLRRRLERAERIFHEHLADVYYQSLTLSDLSTEEDIGMRFEGVEWMLNFTSWEKGRIRWNAAYVNAFSNVSGSDTEQTILRVYAQTTSTLSWLQGWPLGIFSTVSYIKADKMDQKDDDPEGRFLLERIDGRIAKDVKINGYDLEVSATWQHDLSSDPYVLNGNVYQDETRVQLGARLSF